MWALDLALIFAPVETFGIAAQYSPVPLLMLAVQGGFFKWFQSHRQLFLSQNKIIWVLIEFLHAPVNFLFWCTLAIKLHTDSF